MTMQLTSKQRFLLEELRYGGEVYEMDIWRQHASITISSLKRRKLLEWRLSKTRTINATDQIPMGVYAITNLGLEALKS